MCLADYESIGEILVSNDKTSKLYLQDLPSFPEDLVMTPPEDLDYDAVWSDMTE